MEEIKEFELDYKLSKEDIKKINKKLFPKNYISLFIPFIFILFVTILNIYIYTKHRMLVVFIPTIIFFIFSLIVPTIAIITRIKAINNIQLPEEINYHIDSYDKYFYIDIKSSDPNLNDQFNYNDNVEYKEIFKYRKFKNHILLYRTPELAYIIPNDDDSEKILKKIRLSRDINGRAS